MSESFSRADLADLVAILIDAARHEIMPRFKHLDGADVTTKSGPQDLVTVADQAAERFIAARVAERFPGAVFVGEESVAADPSRLGLIAGAELAVVVDPIDGTFNFANGLPLFGVMAAVVAGGRTVAGVIHDPVCGDTACALLGQGAWVISGDGRPDRPLAVARPDALAEMHGAIAWSFLPAGLRERIAANLPRLSAAYGYRNAAHEYRLLASGGCHVLLYGKLMPWDHLAGCLIHAEAGGYAAKFDGTPYLPTDVAGGLLLAPDEASWHAVHVALFGA